MPRQVILQTERLNLFHIESSDWPYFFELQKSHHIMRHVRATEPEETIREKFESSLEHWDKTKTSWYSLMMFCRDDNSFVGMMGFVPAWQLNESAEVGYAIRSTEQGKGYATEALFAVSNHAFLQHGFHKLNAVINVDNLPSIRVAEKIGYKLEGRIRDQMKIEDHWHDALHYGLFPDEMVNPFD